MRSLPEFYSLPEQTEQLPWLLAIHLNWPWEKRFITMKVLHNLFLKVDHIA